MKDLQLSELNNVSGGSTAHLSEAVFNGCITFGMAIGTTVGGATGTLTGLALLNRNCLGLTTSLALGTLGASAGAIVGAGTGFVAGSMLKAPILTYYHTSEYFKR